MIKSYYLNHKKRNFSVASIWIKGGSNMDKNKKKGINKILCTLLTRGCEGFDNLALSEYIESFGAELNQEVFEDGIMISIKSLEEHFSKLLPILDLVINKPILSEIEFQKAKKFSKDLLKKDKENPFNICFEKWKENVYQGHPYAFNTNGNTTDVANITYRDILCEFKNFKMRKKYIISNNPAINGENPEKVDLKFSREKSSPLNLVLNQKNRFTSSTNDTNQTIIMIGNQTCSRKNAGYLPLKLLESYLSFGMSSALFKLFREKNGITYDLGVYFPIREQNAPFLVYLSVSNKNALFAFNLLKKLWKNLLLNQLTEDEIFLAKEKLKSSYLLGNQSLEEILQRKIQLISYEIPSISANDFYSKIDAINPKDIRTITNKYFSNPFISISGCKKIFYKINIEWNKKF